MLGVEKDERKTRLVYIGTARTAPRRDSDRPLKEQRKKRRYESRHQAKVLGESLFASSVEHLFLEDFEEPEKLTSTLQEALGTDGHGVLFVDGGNTFWLWYHAQRAGLAKALCSIRSQTNFRYVGVSAGAILSGITCNTVYWKGWDDPGVIPEDAVAENMEGLGLVNSAIFPHHGPQWEETVATWSSKLPKGCSLIKVRDDDLFLVEGSTSAKLT
eukprot:TRINITY_DN25561_c0_g1_i2.p1 TRINITY_DN25561_c0_g1~~TRINITY_DN25561_c0_g1_i2.p1  ORF type:complete len:215 (-),score=37.28 TRINITY_DN25561_c0_g1_i2:27-671(-)